MSGTAAHGVIDNTLRVHGYPGMFIADGSVIQGNIGVNPSFTITSMAEYCMSTIAPKNSSELTAISKQLILLEEEWRKKI